MGTEILCINRQRLLVGKQKIKKIFIDETLLKINGQDYWLWLAYDEPNLHVYLLFHISRERTRFGNKPIFTDSVLTRIMMLADG
jgi:transposase-like protein